MNLKFIDEYRDASLAKEYVNAISRAATRSWNIMEICGGQTHSIVKYGIDELLKNQVNLIHGPGCPVCVTPVSVIDSAIDLALNKNVILCSFGDMLRVPGTSTDLLKSKAEGADVRVVYSPLDAVKVAQDNREREVVFLAVGFETTAPANAMAAMNAAQLGLTNFSLLVSQVLVPPAIDAILSSPENRVQGFLAPGHVCTVMGMAGYEPLVTKYRVPIVVTGFEPLDILQGLLMCVLQLESGNFALENQYTRSVRAEGNLHAQKLLGEVFEVFHKNWRGIGTIPESGLRLARKYEKFDAEKKFNLRDETSLENPQCMSGLILQGVRKPSQCPSFGVSCNPENPMGAPMVSSEGACSAYYRYRRSVES